MPYTQLFAFIEHIPNMHFVDYCIHNLSCLFREQWQRRGHKPPTRYTHHPPQQMKVCIFFLNIALVLAGHISQAYINW